MTEKERPLRDGYSARMSGLDPALEGWKRKRDAFRWEAPDAFNAALLGFVAKQRAAATA